MSAKGSLSLYFIRSLFVLLSCFLKPSLAFVLKNCTVIYSEDVLADVFSDCSYRKLVKIPDDIPKDSSKLDLTKNLLQRINRDDFVNFSKMRVLSLTANKISHVDDQSFTHLVSLTKLYVDDNGLTNLTANLFEGLTNLTLLDLSQNNIQFIHTSAFQFLFSLKTLRLKYNMLRHITDIQPILQLPQLQNLTISDNQFLAFETNDLLLNTSSRLKVLDVSGNNFENFSITTPIFPDLQMIDMSRCGQNAGIRWDIPDKTLLRSITQLYFSNTSINFQEIQKVLQSFDSLMHLRMKSMAPFIDKGLLAIVCKIPTLRKLDLSFNFVANLSAKLVSCSQLTDLDLSYSVLEKLTKGSINSMKGLRYLTAHDNLLSKVPDDIRGLRSLEVLILENNVISRLSCEDFRNTTSLKELYLNGNQLSKLQKCVFEHLNQLKVLDMTDNQLCMTGGVFEKGLQRLEFLYLSNNVKLTIKKGDFKALSSLKYLEVVSNHNGRMKRKAFYGLKNLQTLIVSLPLDFENNFKNLQHLSNLTIYFFIEESVKSHLPKYVKAFYHLESLKTFTIICKTQHCFPFVIVVEMLQAMKNLEDFVAENAYFSAPDPHTFQFNPHLKSLKIRHTDLSNLDAQLFEPIPNLQMLDLSGSKIKSLDFLAQVTLPALRCLTLRENEITVISEIIFRSLPALAYLDLEDNPFTCDCSNAGFIKWVQTNPQTQAVNGHRYTCSFPVSEQGWKLLDFDIQSCWVDIRFLCFISSACLVLTTLLSSFIHHFLKWQLTYAFYLFLAFLYDKKKKENGAPHHYDAFISYNVHDEAWVYKVMLPVLEDEQGWRLCLHHRDFQPGKPIIENITDAIYGSRKTICVISQRYLQSEWCSREIQMASYRLFDEKKDVLILLFLEDIPAHQLSPFYRMRRVMKRRTYLSWLQAGQHKEVFWENVRRALETGDTPANNTDLLTGPAEY